MENIKDRIKDAAQRMPSRSAVAMGVVQEPLHALPLSISKVAWIGRVHAVHCSLSHLRIGYQTRSISPPDFVSATPYTN